MRASLGLRRAMLRASSPNLVAELIDEFEASKTGIQGCQSATASVQPATAAEGSTTACAGLTLISLARWAASSLRGAAALFGRELSCSLASASLRSFRMDWKSKRRLPRERPVP